MRVAATAAGGESVRDTVTEGRTTLVTFATRVVRQPVIVAHVNSAARIH